MTLVPSPLFYHRLATSSIFRPLIEAADACRDEDSSWERNQYAMTNIGDANMKMVENISYFRKTRSSFDWCWQLAVVQLSLKTLLKIQWLGFRLAVRFWETFWLSPPWFIINEIWPLADRQNYHLTLSLCNNGPKLCCRAIYLAGNTIIIIIIIVAVNPAGIIFIFIVVNNFRTDSLSHHHEKEESSIKIHVFG